jgi:site-specific recombinase XerD
MTSARVERRLGRVAVVGEDGTEVGECERFLERLRVRGLSACTVEAYAYDLVLIYRWLSATDLTLTDVAADELHRFLAWERGRSSQPKSINRRLHTLRLFYRFVHGRELPGGVERCGRIRSSRRDRDLGLQVVRRASTRQLRVKEARKVVEPLTIEQVRELLSCLKRYRDLCIAHAMLLCGLRSGEVLLLRLGDLDFEDRRVRVNGKGNRERSIPLPALLIDLLRRYVSLERPRRCATDRLFVVLQGQRRGQAMTRAALRRIFRSRRKRARLANANPHRLRHTFGADMARSGVRLPILQRMMGHAYAETTLQYVNVSLTDVAAEFHRAIKVLETRYGPTLGDTP